MEKENLQKHKFATEITLQENYLDQNAQVGKIKRRDIIPSELLKVVPLNKKDPNQQFYRQMVQIDQTLSIMTMGWRIASLCRSQQDVILSCFSLLQSEVPLPLKIFFVNDDFINNYCQIGQASKYMWMQTQIMVTDSTRGQQEEKLETSIYRLYSEELLPLLQKFIKTFISWNYIIHNTSAIDIFEAEVIRPVKSFMSSYRKKKRQSADIHES